MYSRRVTKRPACLEGVPNGWYRTTRLSGHLEQLVRAVIILLLAGLTGLVQAEVLDDPTRPPGYRLSAPGTKARAPGWHLSGIWIHEGRRLALINGRLVRPGQMVDGAKLVAVTPTTAKLQRGGRIITVRLVPRRIKQATTTARN